VRETKILEFVDMKTKSFGRVLGFSRIIN